MIGRYSIPVDEIGLSFMTLGWIAFKPIDKPSLGRAVDLTLVWQVLHGAKPIRL